MLHLEIGGAAFHLEDAAISCLRYRRDYGESFPVALSRATPMKAEGLLVRLCHTMIPESERPALLDFAALCRRDGDFLKKALTVKTALLAPDPRHEPDGDGESDEPFDEYKVLALTLAAELPLRLWCELPILHILAVVEEVFALRGDGGETEYQPMPQEEMRTLYPR